MAPPYRSNRGTCSIRIPTTKLYMTTRLHPGWRTWIPRSVLCSNKVPLSIRTTFSVPNCMKEASTCLLTICLHPNSHWIPLKTPFYRVSLLILPRPIHGTTPFPPPIFRIHRPSPFIPTIPISAGHPALHPAQTLSKLIREPFSTPAQSYTAPPHPHDHFLPPRCPIKRTGNHISPSRNPDFIREHLWKPSVPV